MGIETADLRKDLGAIIGSVATTIGVAISWFISSEIFAILVAVLIGFLASYTLQTITQKRAWKREYSIKIAETIYGSLYQDITQILQTLGNGEDLNRLGMNFSKWEEFRQDHRYFMVEKEFRGTLDKLLEDIKEVNSMFYKFKRDDLRSIVNEASEKIFFTNIEGSLIHLNITYQKGRRKTPIGTRYDIDEYLLSNKSPIEDILKKKGGKILALEMTFGQVPASKENVGRFNQFWEACVSTLWENESYNTLLTKTKKLLKKAKNVQNELVKRIEEPWRI